MNSYKSRGILVSVVALGLVATGACAESPTRECRVGADCASGVCGDDGLCVRDQPSNPDGAAPEGDAAVRDASASDAPEGDAALPGCVPDHDGTITAQEVPLAAGLHATYKVGTNEQVSTAGTGSGASRVWDYSAALTSDTSVIVETQPLAGKWFEAKYPGATYASKIGVSTDGTDLLGIFETSPGALLLRGIASPTQTSTSSQLVYTPPASVLAFPLKMGATWTTNTTASGTFLGYDIALTPTADSYVSKIDAAGTLKTPLGSFDVLRVETVLTRKVTTGLVTTPTVIRSFAFVTECYGTIATVTAANNEPNEEFTTAAEIRRIAP